MDTEKENSTVNLGESSVNLANGSPPKGTPKTASATKTNTHVPEKVQGSLEVEGKGLKGNAEGIGEGARRKITTEKGKQYEVESLKERRTSALRQVTREINKIKPLLQDYNSFEFVSSETEILNGLISKLQDAHDKYLNSLEEEAEIDDAVTWFEAHDGAIFKFKQTVCDYMSRAKGLLFENNSIASSHSSRRSRHSKHSVSSSISSKSRLIEARTKIAALEVQAAFLKETQALKMASEELELKKGLAQAKMEEQIYEKANEEDMFSTPVSVHELPRLSISAIKTSSDNVADQGTPQGSCSHVTTTHKSQGLVTLTNTKPTANQGTVMGVSTGTTITSKLPVPIISARVQTGVSQVTVGSVPSSTTVASTLPLSTSVPLSKAAVGGVSSSTTVVSGLTTPRGHPGVPLGVKQGTLHGIQTNLAAAYTPPLYTNSTEGMAYRAPFQSTPPTLRGQGSDNASQSLQPHSFDAMRTGLVPSMYPPYAQSHTAYQEIVDIQRKQAELSETIVTQQARSLLPAHKPPNFSGDAMEFPSFLTAFEALIESKVEDPVERLYFLGQYTTGRAKEVISGCLQRKSDDAYEEAKGILQQQFGDPFKIASAHITKLSSWPQIKPNDGRALQDFAIVLEQARSAMKGMSHMDDLNTAHVLRQLWEKLPRHLRSKWAERNSKTRIAKGRIADFEEFTQFVREQAELATDPVFSEESSSKLSLEEKDKPVHPTFGRKPPRRFKGTSFATEVTEKNKDNASISCILCNKAHDLNDCEQFLQKSLKDRREFVKERKLCYGCFSNQHVAKSCKERQSCKTCNKKHQTAMHDDNWPNKLKNQGGGGQPKETPRVGNKRTVTHSITEAADTPVNLGVLPVWLSHESNPSNKVKTYALLDNASGGTFVKEELAQKLGIEGSKTDLILMTMHGIESVSTRAINGLIVTNFTDEEVRLELPRTFTRNVIPADRSEIPRPDVVSKIDHLRHVSQEIPPYMEDVEVGLLIGLNCPSALRPRDVVCGKDTEPYAIRSLLGWYINGPIYASESNKVCCNRIQLGTHTVPKVARGYVVTQRTVKEQITPQTVGRMFELDFSETERGSALSREDRRFYQIVEDGIVHLENLHYEMPLPLKNQNIKLPNNRAQAEKRLNSLKKRLMSDTKYHTDYCNFMADIISKGYAQKVEANPESKNGRIWYLPHHGVYHAQKPTKVRVVFDCSAKYEGQSLNDNLLQGPDLTSKLIGVLTRFRQERFAFMADIEKMFFQVKVKKEDQDLLRFLWWPDGDIEREAEEYCMTVHLFGAGSSPACANYALRRTADDNESEYGAAVANTLRRNFYVDDVLKSTPTEEKAVELARNVKEICTKGGFNLTKFVGNTEQIIESIPQEHRAENVKNLALGQDKLPIERALGVHWSIESDTLQFRIQLKDNPCTRRGILSTISSVYDPLGLIAPVVLVGKRILQDICHSNTWDEPVDDATRSRWEKWRSELHLLKNLEVPRSFKPEGFGNIVSAQLHSMSDASMTGYGQCSYLRLKDEEGKVHTSFVMGKARVTPKKSVSIPRLELAAATVSVKVANTLKEELEYEEIEDHYWTDSKVVLGFISNESRRFHTYVANRVQVIHDHTDPSQWHYVETASNPADEGSRGMSAKEFLEKSKWIKGPEFLNEVEDKWLKEETFENSVDLDSPEVKKVSVNVNAVKEKPTSIIDRLERFSSWQKARTAVALCLKYKRKLRNRINSGQGRQSDETPEKRNVADKGAPFEIELIVRDLEEAEEEIIRQVQCTAAVASNIAFKCPCKNVKT